MKAYRQLFAWSPFHNNISRIDLTCHNSSPADFSAHPIVLPPKKIIRFCHFFKVNFTKRKNYQHTLSPNFFRGAQWVEILHRGPSQVKNRYYKKRLFVTIMNPNFMGNINLDIFVHNDICRLKNGYFKNIRIVENDKKNFAMIHISSQGMFK